MVLAKGNKLPGVSMEEIINLSKLYGDITVFTGYIDGKPVSSCLLLNFRQKSFYFMAASGKRGRDIYASYAMIYKLFEHLKKQGVIEFDFGGIDPSSDFSKGVTHFKKGFGGDLVEYLGEWDWASSRWLRLAVNLAIMFKKGRL
jgi:lipid II:glycine glycyltransferase (peptidoglycan interpeptide bridge formation enzyme)